MDRLKKFLEGRYGIDDLYKFLIIASIVLILISMFTGWRLLDYISFALLAVAIFRAFSRNISRRHEENYRFLNWWNSLKSKIYGLGEMAKGLKTYRYFRCPMCRQMLRVPRGKGRVLITCPKCRNKFQRRT